MSYVLGIDWGYELWVYSYLVFKHEGLLVFSLFNLINLVFFSDYFSYSFLQWFIHAEINYIVYAWRKKIIIR